jgi:hypothetical protein
MVRDDMSEKKRFNGPWLWCAAIGFIVLWFFGVFHAYTQHGQTKGNVAAVLPPYAFFLSVEAIIAAHAEPLSRQDAVALRVNGVLELRSACFRDKQFQERVQLSAEQYEVFCICSAQMIAEGYPPDESEYVARHGRNSPEFKEFRRNSMRSCNSSARYLGG